VRAQRLAVSRSRHRIEAVPEQLSAAATEMLERFVAGQVRGHRISEGEPIRMNGIPEGLVCRHVGSMDDPDFNNLHIRIERRDTDE